MNRPTLTRVLADNEPWLVWNAFIGVIAQSPETLTRRQRLAHFVFLYESEVQNGGHLQYFENHGVVNLAETITSLGSLGAVCHQTCLKEAADVFLNRPRERIESAEDYCTIALEDEFDAFDTRFHNCSPPLQQVLEHLLAERLSEFVEII